MKSELYQIPFRRADGSETTLAEHGGKVLLLVNVASKCGLTPQYDGLQKLFARYRDRGFLILGFPANEFGSQEPGTDPEIQQFCRLNYGVDFPVNAKLVVKGAGQHPLYRFLTEAKTKAESAGGLTGVIAGAKSIIREKRSGGWSAGAITWNFEKFLVDRAGMVVARFAPDIKPEDPRIIEAVESELERIPDPAHKE